MITSEHARPGLHGVVVVAAAGLAATLALTACGGGSGSSGSGGGTSPSTSPSPTTETSGSGPSGAAPGRRGGNFPGAPAASGLIAQITGTTMQVQNQQTGQVAVSWTTTTRFTQTVTEPLRAVKVGDCVVATGASGTSGTTKSFTAATLVVMPATTNTCTRASGPRPSGFPTGARPSNVPSRGAFPSGHPSGARGTGSFGAFATGKVTSISGATLVIKGRDFARRTSTGAPSNSTTSTTVKTTSKTKVTTEASATARALKVGRCVTAQGKADSSGAVSATSVAITDAVGGRCISALGRRGGFVGGSGGRNGG